MHIAFNFKPKYFMKKHFITLCIFISTLGTFSQYSMFENYGDIFSFGVEISQTKGNFQYTSNPSHYEEYDTTLNYSYLIFSPGVYINFPIYLESEKHMLYANLNFLFNFNANSMLNEEEYDSFGLGFGTDFGVTYFYGMEHGLGAFGSLLGTFQSSFDPGAEIFGPSLRLGVQVPIEDHLVQFYLKGTYNVLNSPEISQHEYFMENGVQTFSATHFSLGIIYRGIW